MAASAEQDIDLILAFLEDRLPAADAERVAARLKTDKAFAKQLAVQARVTTGLEALAKLAALAPEMQAAAGNDVPENAGSGGHRKVTRMAGGRGRRSWKRHFPLAAAAVLLCALGLGGWWYATREPATTAGVEPAPKQLPQPSLVQLAEVEAVPAQLVEKDRPVVIRSQGATGRSETVKPGMLLYPGDRLVTLQASAGGSDEVQVSLKCAEGGTVDIGRDSEIIFPTAEALKSIPIAQTGFELKRGRLYVDAQALEPLPMVDPRTPTQAGPAQAVPEFYIQTPSARLTTSAGAYELVSGNAGSVARVQSGLLRVVNTLGTQVVQAFEECSVDAEQAPGLPMTVFAGAIWRGRQGLAGGEPKPNVALAGALVLERPTLVCLGARWVVHGDQNRNAVVYCKYRPAPKTGAPGAWRRSLNFWPVESAGWPEGYRLDNGPGLGDTLYAGSLFDLAENTLYELEFHIDDPDGQNAMTVRQLATRPAPTAAADGRQLYVVPDAAGQGGGTGTAADPFQGLAAADQAARPGDIFNLGAGEYTGTVTLKGCGEAGKPVVWRGAPGGRTILQGAATAVVEGAGGKAIERVISANGLHDVVFEGLTLCRANYGIVAHSAQRIGVVHCRFRDCMTALTASDKDAQVEDFYIADNDLIGQASWPSENKGAEPSRAIYIAGQGHVICHNRLRNFGDGIDTAPGRDNAAIDIYLNDISAMTDDGIELDFSHRNVRCFQNRLTNLFQGISVQPVYGGPAYVLRNTIYNVELEAIKLHSSPNGVLVLHNTAVRNGSAAVLGTSDPVYHCLYRNNLWIGTSGDYGLMFDAPMLRCDFDYDGVGGSFDKFLLWNRNLVKTVEQARAAEQHATVFDPAGSLVKAPAIADGPAAAVAIDSLDLRPAAGSPVIDKGCVLPGIDDDYQGQAPDLGAFEAGQAVPAYGPRPAGQ